jgi:hypothetical protein
MIKALAERGEDTAGRSGREATEVSIGVCGGARSRRWQRAAHGACLRGATPRPSGVEPQRRAPGAGQAQRSTPS